MCRSCAPTPSKNVLTYVRPYPFDLARCDKSSLTLILLLIFCCLILSTSQYNFILSHLFIYMRGERETISTPHPPLYCCCFQASTAKFLVYEDYWKASEYSSVLRASQQSYSRLPESQREREGEYIRHSLIHQNMFLLLPHCLKVESILSGTCQRNGHPI